MQAGGVCSSVGIKGDSIFRAGRRAGQEGRRGWAQGPEWHGGGEARRSTAALAWLRDRLPEPQVTQARAEPGPRCQGAGRLGSP